ncbi:hypothetical protein ACVRXQ_03210 [Streptococcus panodentis]|uniref:Signal peptide containing protein n=1 Tax=Streptococcus panodentis TaxID=1581472 RepID=A0ABS5AY94_9STRE|nr:hypothetical protein [Streptococcus panodentis]MBP2621557.1 hypothetical protein [Streptococcus panodentis]
MKKLITLIFLAGLAASLAIGSTVILANDDTRESNKNAVALADDSKNDAAAQAPTLEIMTEKAKEDPTLLETLDRFSDHDQVIAYPENLGGGFSVKAPDSQPLVGEILDNDGDTVIYRDDQPVTIAQVKAAIQNDQ